MNLGVENKKSVYALIGLGVVAAYMVYSQLLSGPSYPAARPANPNADVSISGIGNATGPDVARDTEKPVRPTSHKSNGEFKPVLIPKKKEDRIANIFGIDPTIRMDWLEKVLKVPPAGGERDLFQILKGPPVKATAMLDPSKEPKLFRPYGPAVPPPPVVPKPVVASTPPPTPIPLKYYAYSAIHPNGKRSAFFYDGDDIVMADEGTVLKGRYRIVQIGTDKVLVEDMVEKRRQSVAIEPEVTG